MIKAAVSFTVQRPGSMTDKGRKEVAAWPRRQATNLIPHGEKYNDTSAFRARYYY